MGTIWFRSCYPECRAVAQSRTRRAMRQHRDLKRKSSITLRSIQDNTAIRLTGCDDRYSTINQIGKIMQTDIITNAKNDKISNIRIWKSKYFSKKEKICNFTQNFQNMDKNAFLIVNFL